MRANCTPLLWLPASLVVLAVVFVFVGLQPASAQTPDPLADPVVKGAWLYIGNCQRCHGDYAKARVAEGLSAKELKAAVSGDARPGCAIAWSLANGGPLPGKDIGALVAYMTAWEEAGAQPALPPLPPQPTRTPTPAPTVITTGAETTAAASASPTPPPLAPELLAAFAADPVAHGAWLYTRNCQRCHQTYATARMGQGLDINLLKQRIQEGNPGSNMPAFSFRLGGPLKASEVSAVVAFVSTWEATGGPPALPAVVATAVTAEAKAAAAAAVALPAGAAALEPAARGLLYYGTLCAPCHGAAGEGGTGPALAQFRPEMRPESALRTVIVEGVAGTAMIAWSQLEGGILDNGVIDDLLALLLQWRRAMPATQATASDEIVNESVAGVIQATLNSAPWVPFLSFLSLLAVVLTLVLTASAFWQD